MFFHIDQRRLWIRTISHTLVHDRNPFFEEIRQDQRGNIMRILRVWLSDESNDRPIPKAYLGSLRCCVIGPDRSELRRLLKRASASTALAGESSHGLCHQLMQSLREHLNK